MNGTTSAPKSVLCYVVDKVKLICSDLSNFTPMPMSRIKVSNKSLSQKGVKGVLRIVILIAAIIKKLYLVFQ